MSSNGVMLQDYVPNAINNVTEQIWCAGAVLPAGKRVVIGHMRDGWLEVTFTMGKTQDFIGMAMVPPYVVGIEPALYSYGMGMAPKNVSALRRGVGRWEEELPADLPEGWPEAGGMGAYAMQSAFSRARARVAPRSPAIDQSAPLPAQLPQSPQQGQSSYAQSMPLIQGTIENGMFWVDSQWFVIDTFSPNPPAQQANVPFGFRGHGTIQNGKLNVTGNMTVGQHTTLGPYTITGHVAQTVQPGQNTFSETARRARMEQALPADQRRSPAYSPPPYQWGGLHGMMPGATRDRLRGMGASRPGVGAAGASAFTMTAAQALNDHLVTNNCAGCSDMTSRLRQLTFAFKAAVMTDTGIAPQMNLNMSNALAMTAYGSGTDQALSLVLGASKSYTNGPCTDDNGTCLGNPTPIVPPAVSALEQQFVHAIQAAMQQAPYIPQTELVKGLIQGFAALVNQIGFELAKLPPPIINVDNHPPPAPPAKAAAEKSIWPTIVIGGLIGTAVLATGAFAYTHARRA